MDLISVIIPYYKKKKFIDYSIKSIFDQTHSNLEIIIVYDDENKLELKYLKETYGGDKRIKFLINDVNIGAGYSRNKGMEIANGEFISFLDADDVWEKNKIQTQLLFMKKNKLSVTHTSYKIIDEKNNLLGSRIARDFSSIKDIIKSCDIGLSSVMIKKDIIANDIKFCDLKTKEDFVLWLRILKKGIKIFAIDRELMFWRRTRNSLSSSIFQKLFDGYKVYNKYMNFNFFLSVYYLICLSLNYVKKKLND